MSTPKPDDPRRPFFLALSSTKVLGIMSTAWGMFFLFAFGYLNSAARFRIYFKLAGIGIWLLPGVAFLVAWIFLRGRRPWAITLALVATVWQTLMAAAIFAAWFVYSPISFIPVLITAVWLAALLQLIVHLGMSYSALRLIDLRERRVLRRCWRRDGCNRSLEKNVVKPIDDPVKYLAIVGGGAKALGILFTLLGCLYMLPILLSDAPQHEVAWASSATLLMLGPGITYMIASRSLKRGRQWAAEATFWTAVGQATAALFILAVGIMRMVPKEYMTVVVAAVFTLFFAPAVLVYAVQARRATRAIRLLPFEGRAFEVMAIPVRSIDPTDISKEVENPS